MEPFLQRQARPRDGHGARCCGRGHETVAPPRWTRPRDGRGGHRCGRGRGTVAGPAAVDEVGTRPRDGHEACCGGRGRRTVAGPPLWNRPPEGRSACCCGHGRGAAAATVNETAGRSRGLRPRDYCGGAVDEDAGRPWGRHRGRPRSNTACRGRYGRGCGSALGAPSWAAALSTYWAMPRDYRRGATVDEAAGRPWRRRRGRGPRTVAGTPL